MEEKNNRSVVTPHLCDLTRVCFYVAKAHTWFDSYGFGFFLFLTELFVPLRSKIS